MFEGKIRNTLPRADLRKSDVTFTHISSTYYMVKQKFKKSKM